MDAPVRLQHRQGPQGLLAAAADARQHRPFQAHQALGEGVVEARQGVHQRLVALPGLHQQGALGGRREQLVGCQGPHVQAREVHAQPAQAGGGQHRAVQGSAAQFAVPHPLQPGGHIAPDPGEDGPGQGLGQETQAALRAGADDRILRGVTAHQQQVGGILPARHAGGDDALRAAPGTRP